MHEPTLSRAGEPSPRPDAAPDPYAVPVPSDTSSSDASSFDTPPPNAPSPDARSPDATDALVSADSGDTGGSESVRSAAASPESEAPSGRDPESEGDPERDARAADGAESPRAAWNAPRGEAEAPPREADPVTFSVAGGTYHPPVTLWLACATGDAEIRYTEDGSEPTPESALYTRGDPLFLSASAVVSARAFAEGLLPGPVATERYELRAPEWRVVEPEDRADAVEHRCSHHDPAFAPGWSLAAASTRGRLHAHRGAWREDAYAFARRGGWMILAVSDGAGSAPLSRVGSRTACERAVEELRLRLPEEGPGAADVEALKAEELPTLRARLANAGRAALNGIREEAAARGQPAEAFAATLLLAVLCPWNGGHLAASLQVGDGQVALLTRAAGGGGHECKLLGEAEHGAHSSETRFLTTRGVEERLEHRVRFALPESLAAAALMTDGVSDDFFPEERRMVELFTAGEIPSMAGRDGAPVAGVLRGVAASPDPARALAEWLEYDRKGSSDDRTLLLLWARP